MNPSNDLTLPQLGGDLGFSTGEGAPPPVTPKSPADLAPLRDVPVTLTAVLGRVRLPVGELLQLGPGTLLELDRQVGEAIDIRVNDRLVARGEVVLVDDRLGVTMTEIVRPT